MNGIFIERQSRISLYPLNLAKPSACLRVGMYTFEERWKLIFPEYQFSYETEDYLQTKFPLETKEDNLYLNPLFLPEDLLVKALSTIQKGEVIFYKEQMLAFRGSKEQYESGEYESVSQLEGEFTYIQHPWDFFTYNHLFLEFDLHWKDTKNVSSIPSWVKVSGDANKVYIHPSATLENCTLNTTEGFIFIDENAIIQDGALLRGNLFIGKSSTVRMGTKIYGNTTIGHQCKVGGELSNSVIQQNSNKAHEGYLGNSVIGEWCNLGADTNNSNLKNTYSEVDCWSIEEKKYIPTGLQFCGMMMGDHSKSAINTQFNTGTMVGFSAQVFQAGFPPKHISSFSFGGDKNSPKMREKSAIETAKKVMARRGIEFTEEDEAIFHYLFTNN